MSIAFYTNPVQIHRADKWELQNRFNFSEDEVSRIKANLIAADVNFGVLLVNPGDKFAGKIAETQYFCIAIMDVMSIYKTPCK